MQYIRYNVYFLDQKTYLLHTVINNVLFGAKTNNHQHVTYYVLYFFEPQLSLLYLAYIFLKFHVENSSDRFV
jgi:hypothetical protein